MKKSKKVIFCKTLLIILFYLFNYSNSVAQINQKGVPLITNYSDATYNAFPQNWQAVQDKRGVMYFANQTGILEFDGRAWRLIKLNDGVFMRSLAVDADGIVYFGTSGSFGYLEPDKQGQIMSIALSDLIEDKESVKFDFWKIIPHKNNIYFFNEHSLFRYNKTNGTIKTWDLNYDIFQVFLLNDNMYLSSFDRGLIMLKDEVLTDLKNGDFFYDIGIVSLISLSKNKMLAVTYDRGIFSISIDDNQYLDIKLFDESLNVRTQNILFYSAEQLNDYEIALATLGSGLFVIDKEGRLVSVIDESMGLISNNVSYIYNAKNDSEKSVLWVVTDKGISKVEWHSPIRIFNENNGVKGAVTDAIRYQDKFYIATMEGLYYYSINKETQLPVFNRIQGIDKEVWQLSLMKHKNKDYLIASSSYNLFLIDGIQATQLTKSYTTYSALQLASNPTVAYVSLDRGLAKLDITNALFVDAGAIQKSGVTSNSRIISEDLNGNLWLFSSKDGVIHYDTKKDTIIRIFNQKTDSLLPIINRIFKVEGRLLLGTKDGIYEYDEMLQNFIPTKLFKNNASAQKIEILRVYVDKHIAWIVAKEDNKNVIGKLNFKDETIDRMPFNRIINNNIWGFYKDNDDIMIFSSDLLYVFNNQYEKNYFGTYNALIRRVVLNNDSIIFWGTNYVYNDKKRVFSQIQHPETVKTLPFAYNNISFEFSAAFFEAEEHLEYSFFLEGNDANWSEWSKRADKEYTNLFEGKYTFHVKAKNVYGVESTIASYSFIILPPWYRTVWAYISYLILLVLLIWGIVKLSIYRLQKINEAYGKYLPGSFLKMLDKRRVIDFRLGDMTEKEMTIMFSDIRSYTSLSESMSSKDNFRFLVRYLKYVGEMLNKNKGFPVQYYGDGVMAMFHGKTDNAVQAAIDMHKKVSEYSASRVAKGRRSINIGVGLHHGSIIMGIRGDEWRWEGGIVGDAVNITARIEGLTKLFNTASIVSEDVYDKLEKPQDFNFRYLGKVRVKGKENPIRIYELIDGNPESAFKEKMLFKNDFNVAVQLFTENKIHESLQIFNEIVNTYNDKAAAYYVNIINKIGQNPPSVFDGTIDIDTK